MKTLLMFLVAVGLLVGGAYYYLFVPKNLGVSASGADTESALKKLGVAYEALPDGSTATIIVRGAHDVKVSFSSEELTALANNRKSQYGYFPFKKVQIKINADGGVEGSATINYEDAVAYLKTLGVSAAEIAKAAAEFKIPNAEIPVYLKVGGEVRNNVSNIDVRAVTVANIPVPQDLVDKYAPGLDGLVETVIRSRQPSYRIDVLEVKDGKVNFQGTAPDIEQAAR